MKMLSAKEVGDLVGVSAKTVINRALAGDLAYHDFGTYRFELSDVEEWIKRHRVVAIKKNDPAPTGSKRK